MLKFKRNMGTLDRSIRVIVGLTLWIIGPATNLFVLNNILEMMLAVIGTFAILSAMFAYCLLYEFTGTNTR